MPNIMNLICKSTTLKSTNKLAKDTAFSKYQSKKFSRANKNLFENYGQHNSTKTNRQRLASAHMPDLNPSTIDRHSIGNAAFTCLENVQMENCNITENDDYEYVEARNFLMEQWNNPYRRDVFTSKSTLEPIIEECATTNDVNSSAFLRSRSNKMSTFKTINDLSSLISNSLEEKRFDERPETSSEQDSWGWSHLDVYESSKIEYDPNKYLGLVGGMTCNKHCRVQRLM